MNTLLDQALSLLRNYTETEHRGNVASASRALGIPPGTLSQWLAGIRTPNLKALDPVFQKLGISFQGGGADVWKFSYVPRVHRDVGGGFGPGGIDIVDRQIPVEPEFLKAHGLEAQNLIATGIANASMSPTFKPGDLMLIDRSDTKMQEGCYYLIEIQDQWIARRVEMNVEGLKLIADNVAYGSMQVRPETLAQLKVIGRIVWCWKQM